MATRTELKCTYCGRTITGDEYSHSVEEFKPRTIEESREQTGEEKRGFQEQIAIREEKHIEEHEFLDMFYQTQNRMNQKKLLTQLADYEQELYEKDQYIQRLENETGGLKVPTCHRSGEKVL
jgi:hypothetical protein